MAGGSVCRRRSSRTNERKTTELFLLSIKVGGPLSSGGPEGDDEGSCVRKRASERARAPRRCKRWRMHE